MRILLFVLIQFCFLFGSSQTDSLELILKNKSGLDSFQVQKAIRLISPLIYESPDVAVEKLENLYELNRKNNNVFSNISIKQNLGLAYNSLGKYVEALREYIEAVNYCQDKYIDQKYQLYNNISQIYTKTKEYDKALSYIDKAIDYNKSHHLESALALNFNNKAIIYEGQGQFQKALAVHFEAKQLRQKSGNNINLAQSYLNISRMYLEIGKLDSSLVYAKLSEKICDSLKSDMGLSYVNGILSQIFYEQKNYKQAEVYALKVLLYAEKTHTLEKLMSSNALLYNIYKDQGNYKDALERRNNYIQFKDSVFNVENAKKLISVEYENKINLNRKEQEVKDRLAKEEQTKKSIVIWAVCAILIIVVVFTFVLFGRFKLIKKQKLLIEEQKQIVEEKQKEVLDSIHYAKRIQNTLLAHDDFLNEFLPDNFILFKPKDIVSGDFYWATLVSTQQLTVSNGGQKLQTAPHQLFYLAVCDSTGHGVPGAFMSLLNINFLNEAINEKRILAPHLIFDYVRERLINSVSREDQKDGFDGILLCIEMFSSDKIVTGSRVTKITYAAANNAPIFISGSEGLNELPKDKMPVGVGERCEGFRLHELELKPGDTLYLYTDGYADQFGGEKGKKFKYKALNELLLKNSRLSLSKQKDILNTTFENWRGDLEQVDDVCVIGIKF